VQPWVGATVNRKGTDARLQIERSVRVWPTAPGHLRAARMDTVLGCRHPRSRLQTIRDRAAGLYRPPLRPAGGCAGARAGHGPGYQLTPHGYRLQIAESVNSNHRASVTYGADVVHRDQRIRHNRWCRTDA
jgi:hypothetical protein